ncbi:MAG: ribosomal L7Ae/L30e/S12e/Gadd45 family protein [Bradymonadaceae bacterium]
MSEPETGQNPHTVRCAGCQQDGPALELERFVYHDSVGLVHDMRREAPGEATWTHPLVGCLRPAVWSGFSRELAAELPELDAVELVEKVRANVRARWRERTADALRMGGAVAGAERVDRRIASGDLELLVLASDAGGDEIEQLRRAADRADVAVIDELSAETLGRVVDSRRCRAMAFPSGERTEAIGRDLEKIICLEADDVRS